jgi:DNA helicase HerA-like ATPase
MDLSSIRIREHFGIVSNDTHTGQFCFLISPPKNRSGLEKHDYVLLDHPLFGEACQILAVITDITSYEQVAGGSSIGDRMGKMLATAEIVGYIDLRNENKPLCEVLVPPNPGSHVYVPFKKFLEGILNRNVKGEVFKMPIQIGMFEGSSGEEIEGRVNCYIDLQDFEMKNTIITAVAGAGKTHNGKLLVQKMLDNTSKQIVLFDPYSEYSSILTTSSKTTITTKMAKMDKDSLIKEIKKGQITCFTAQGLTLEEKRSFYNTSLQLLLKLRIDEKIRPLYLIIEEAESLKGEELDQIVTEGRKIGIFVCLITTHPSELGGRILSQMGYQIIGKTIDKEDIEYLANITGTAKALPDMVLGDWIINGISFHGPMKMRMNELAARTPMEH